MRIWNPLKNFKTRLTNIGNKEPLHFFSLFIIIALDIFVLINIFQGLQLQKQQLDQPYEVIPHACENYLLDNPESISYKDSKLSSLEKASNTYKHFDYINHKYSSGARIIEDNNREKVYEKCREIYTAAENISRLKARHGTQEYRDQVAIQTGIISIEKQTEQIRDLQNNNRNFRENYDTQLLEVIANQPEDLSITSGNAENAKKRITSNEERINLLKVQINKTQQDLLQNPAAIEFFKILETNKPDILAKQKSLEFWYPLKKAGMQLGFILPIFLFFLWMYRRMLQRENSLVSLIFSHLLLVSMIPILAKLFELTVEILPFHFFADLIALLDALNIVALWNYLMIIAGILITLLVIYFLQKKVFSAQITWNKRISKKRCWNCGKNKPTQDEHFCSFCGEAQLEKCIHCHKNKFVKALFCKECGDNSSKK